MKRIHNPKTGAAIPNFSVGGENAFEVETFEPSTTIEVSDAIGEQIEKIYGFLEVTTIEEEKEEEVVEPEVKNKKQKGKKK